MNNLVAINLRPIVFEFRAFRSITCKVPHATCRITLLNDGELALIEYPTGDLEPEENEALINQLIIEGVDRVTQDGESCMVQQYVWKV